MKFLKKIFSGIASFFASRPEESVEPLLKPFDENEIRERLDIVRKAHEHGTARVPAPDQVQESPLEHTIKSELGNLRSMGFKYGAHRKVLIQRGLDEVELTRDANRISQLGDEFVRAADRILSMAQPKIQITGKQMKEHKQLLDAFRLKHHLPETDAKLPTKNKLSQRKAWLILAVVFEGVFNAMWFANGMADGLAGGFVLAAGFSIVNVALSFLAGRIFTNINHVNLVRRLCGWMSGLIGLLATVAMGMVVAYFRYALGVLEDGSESALSLAGNAFANHVSPFIDFESIILFAATVAFGLMATWHAYHWTDPYPGYAKVFRAYKEAFLVNLKAITELRKKLESEKDRMLSQLEAEIKNAQQRILRFKRGMNDKIVVGKTLTAYTVKVEHAMRSLVQCYRYENQLKRPVDCPRPAYFDEPVIFESDTMPDFSVDDDQQRLEEQEALLEEMIATIEPTRKKIEASFNQQYELSHPLESNA
jgi:hypothetical protein